MILKQDLKWSPDGMRVEVIRAGLAERGTSAKSSKATKEKKATTSKEG
ncbi:hypothetical protein M9053_001632 [Escherichia coli]|nr:hypothetical protein [Escherichia coli]